ncbi:hypothetical protein GCM10020255_002540 [Rhodococcus baikonurensis]|jgi:transcriptional regulator with XRE-family HTH domain
MFVYLATVCPHAVTVCNYADSMTTVTRRILKGFDPAALIRARTLRKLTRSDLARIASVSLSALGNWEAGRGTPQVDTLARVAAALEVPMETLIPIPEKDRTLADLRNIAGITQPQLGKATGISTTAIGALERAEVRLAALEPTRIDALIQSLNTTRAGFERAYANAKNRPPGTPA